MAHLPILLDLRDKPCVVIGGGDVAWRKVRTLVERGAIVRVIAPAAREEIMELANAGTIDFEPRAYRPGDLANAFLCVAAADDPEANAAARHEASVSKVLINVVDDPAGSDYQVPSFFEDGPLLVAVATGGASPAVARTLRRMIQAWLGESMGAALAIVERFRDRVKAEIPEAKARVKFWETAINPDNLESARQGRLAEFEKSLEQEMQKVKDQRDRGPKGCE